MGPTRQLGRPPSMGSSSGRSNQLPRDSEDLSSLSPSCSTEPQLTVFPGPDRNHDGQEDSNHHGAQEDSNHGHQEDSNRGDQKDTPQGQERVTVSLDVNSETPTFNIIVKEEEDWELDNTGDYPSSWSAGEESPSTSGEPEQHQENHTAIKSHSCLMSKKVPKEESDMEMQDWQYWDN
ncbi:unnamed protein product [Coregonus sp. 'balchen']|nr:unnamed protein product [Coregonus sp. 'balchen']